ncbi:MAG: hypothetical protein EXR76_01095 [Myxococcales bacterium]|nr:hypothetical protein [Myxococcales bacterium]
MRSDAACVSLALLLGACSGSSESGGPAPLSARAETISRTDSVKAAPGAAAATTAPSGDGFCEKTFGPGQKPFVAPVERPIGGVPAAVPTPAGWSYVNLWATWCKPCIEEMGLFARWRDGFQREGMGVSFDLWSIDALADEAALKSRVTTGLPGTVRWVESDAAFATFLDSVGLDKTAAIPIHLLVDPAKNLRCVRVGSIHPEDYAQVKSFIATH